MKWLHVALVLALVNLSGAVHAQDDDDEAAQAWQEVEPEWPGAPLPASLQSFHVSPSNPNRYFIDLSSLNVAQDGVVRYVLVVETAGGARNVSFEGIRCETREQRIYATGRRDGAWSRARNPAWMRIRDISAYRHHAALYREYFCPGGLIAASSQHVVDALRQGMATQRGSW